LDRDLIDSTERLEAELAQLRLALATEQEDLLQLQQRLARAERLAALGAIVGKLAHELGTPLHSVAGHLDLLLRDPALPAAVRERAEIVAGEVDRLGALLRGYLRRLRAPGPRLAPTDVNAEVRRILRLLDPLLGRRSVAVELDLDPAAAAPFPCDARQIEQVTLNLVHNALDAMPGGGRLILRTAVTESGRAISVADDGQGIAPEALPHVFEPFFTTKAAGQGTGLGLSLCREIARGHGGDIVLDSRPGLGTVVTLTLVEPPA